MDTIEIFVQGEGIRDVALVRVSATGTVADVVAAARGHGGPSDGAGVVVMLEDADEALDPTATLQAAGIGYRERVHVHRCRRIGVTANYNGRPINRDFPPSATMRRVKAWVVGRRGFDLDRVDATEHVLQRCNSIERPDEDVHIGTLVTVGQCELCFDLVAKRRVEG